MLTLSWCVLKNFKALFPAPVDKSWTFTGNCSNCETQLPNFPINAENGRVSLLSWVFGVNGSKRLS
jgi:hypothetical protein